MSTDKRKRSTKLHEFPTPLLGRVEVVQQYNEQKVDLFQGNPLIEALPVDLTDAEFASRITTHIPITKEQRQLPPHDRDHYIEHIRRFYHPMKKAYDIHRQISRQIRGSYVGRNPLSTRFWSDIRTLSEKMAVTTPEEAIDIIDIIAQSRENFEYIGSTTSALIGVSGMGKTMLVKRILQLLSAQVYFHSSYKGLEFPFQQITWLFMECPSNASVKSFLDQILFTIDAVTKQVDGVGTNYYRDMALNGRLSAENMILPV